MNIRDDNYTHSETEFQEMWALLRESSVMVAKPLNWLFARLEDWKYGGNSKRVKSDPSFFVKNVHLWRNDEKKLVGFCISEYGGNSIYLQIHPQDRGLEEAMYNWIQANWAQEKAYIETYAYDYDTTRQQVLTRLGYQDCGDNGYLRKYDVSQDYPAATLEPGFSIASLKENPNVESHIEAVRNAFNRPSLDQEWFTSKTTAPSYSFKWDLAVISPEGKHVAFCLAWLDLEHHVAELDPIGTHSDYRQKGLAKAVITECFRRLKVSGIRYAYIGSAPEPYASNRLYDSLHPIEKYQEHKWVKELKK